MPLGCIVTSVEMTAKKTDTANDVSNNKNVESEAEIDGRIGKRMNRALYKLYKKDGVAQSKWALAQQLYQRPSTSHGMPVVDRCIDRGLIRIEEDHEQAEPRGAGAIVLTDAGEEYVEESGEREFRYL